MSEGILTLVGVIIFAIVVGAIIASIGANAVITVGNALTLVH